MKLLPFATYTQCVIICFRLRDMYKRIDQKYIKPCLLRENHFRDPKIIETFENLTNKDAMEFMKRNPTQVLHTRHEQYYWMGY